MYNMVLTPDQKKRIAALDSGLDEPEEVAGKTGRIISARAKTAAMRIRASSLQAVAFKLLIACALMAVAAYFIVINQLHKIDFRAVFSSDSRGSPIVRLSTAVKLQKKKVDLLEKGRGHLLVGEYNQAFKTAMEIEKLDSQEPQIQMLVDDTVDAVTQKASREFESGEIEAALADIRLGLQYRPDHGTANELYKDVADRLLLEAQAHYDKKEYSKLIVKAQEVVKIGKDPSNMAAYNLLARTNDELLDDASELLISKRYTESLKKVQLSLKIDKNDTTALRLLKQISDYVDKPVLELRGIIKKGKAIYARLHLPATGRTVTVRKGRIVTNTNMKVIDIDPKLKQVRLIQIYTGEKLTIQQTKASY